MVLRCFGSCSFALENYPTYCMYRRIVCTVVRLAPIWGIELSGFIEVICEL